MIPRAQYVENTNSIYSFVIPQVRDIPEALTETSSNITASYWAEQGYESALGSVNPWRPKL